MIATIIIMSFILLIEMPSFIRAKNIHGLCVYLSVFAVTATFSLLLVSGKINSPVEAIQLFFRDILSIRYD